MTIPRWLLRLASSCVVFMGLVASLPAEVRLGAVVWTLTDPKLIGGRATTVFGQPEARAASPTDGAAIFFDGFDDGLLIAANPLAGAPAFTIEVLFKPDSSGPAEQRFFHVQDTAGNRALLETRMIEGRWALDTFLSSVESKQKRVLFDRTKTHPADRWTWVALVYHEGRMTHYIDGTKELEDAVLFPPLGDGQLSLGVRQNKVSWFKGGIREVRFHRTALPAEKLQREPDAPTSAPPSASAPATKGAVSTTGGAPATQAAPQPAASTK